MNEAKVIQVILTDLAREGLGTQSDPISVVEQLWTLDGELILEVRLTGETLRPKLGPGWEQIRGRS